MNTSISAKSHTQTHVKKDKTNIHVKCKLTDKDKYGPESEDTDIIYIFNFTGFSGSYYNSGNLLNRATD